MTSDAFGIIYTGEASLEIRDLTNSRAVAAVPFGGRYRCIDFILSCMVNTGVSNVGVITQKNYHSLMDHLGQGKEWDLNRKRDGLFILPPFLTKENSGIYKGTVDALRSVMGYIRRSSQKYVILSGAHTVFNTTFDDMLAFHRETGADITVMYVSEPPWKGEGFEDLRLKLAEDGRVTAMRLDPSMPFSECRGCDVVIMEKALLEYLVDDCCANSAYDFYRDMLVRNVNRLKIYGWRYDGLVARIDSVLSYYRENMALLTEAARADLFDPRHPVYTKVKDEAPAVYGGGAEVHNCIVADGCVIEGAIENCVLFRGVTVGRGATVKNCILMQGARVGEAAEIGYVIADKGASVGAGVRLTGYERFPIILRKGMSV